jgi:hypothetical protein
MGELYISSRRRLIPRNVLEFFIHKSTALVLTLCSVASSVALIIVSIFRTHPKEPSHKQPLDDGFYASFSQAILSLVLYILPLFHRYGAEPCIFVMSLGFGPVPWLVC